MELTTRDGLPPPVVPDGECIMTTLGDGSIRIDHADPRILISGELLAATMGIRNGSLPLPVAHLDLTGCKPGHGYIGAVLRIHGVNRQVVYRVTDHAPRINCYIAEWPD